MTFSKTWAAHFRKVTFKYHLLVLLLLLPVLCRAHITPAKFQYAFKFKWACVCVPKSSIFSLSLCERIKVEENISDDYFSIFQFVEMCDPNERKKARISTHCASRFVFIILFIEFCVILWNAQKENATCSSVILWPFKLILMYTHTTTTNNTSKYSEALFKYIHVGTHADKASAQCHCIKNSKRKKLQIYIMLYFVSVWWDGVCFCFKMVFALFSLNSSIWHSCQHTHTYRKYHSNA